MKRQIYWEGSCRIPKIKIDHNKILYMRDGFITTEDANVIATYERVLDNAGLKGDMNQIILTCKKHWAVTLHDPTARFIRK